MGLCLDFLSVLEGESYIIGAVDGAVVHQSPCQLSRVDSVSASGICLKALRKAPMYEPRNVPPWKEFPFHGGFFVLQAFCTRGFRFADGGF